MRYAEENTQRSAAAAARELDDSMAMVRGLGRTLGALSATGGTRAQADAVQRELLEANPGLLGVWSGWEPDAFDGQDARFRGSRGSDATGRFVSYWHREGSDIALAPLTH